MHCLTHVRSCMQYPANNTPYHSLATQSYYDHPAAYQKGFTAMEVAIMFSFYELAGVATNLLAGLMGARWGLKTTLLSGLGVQLIGIGMLFGWQDSWSKTEAIVYVTASQLACGVAKDLTKLGGKTVTELIRPRAGSRSSSSWCR